MKKLLIVLASLLVASVAQAVTTNIVVGGSSEFPGFSKRNSFVITKTVDMSVIAPASGDVIECISVSTNWLVVAVAVTVETIEDSAATIGVGDGGSATRYLTASDIAASATKVSTLVGFTYTGTDTVDITVNSANVDTAVLTVKAWVIDFDQASGN